MHRSKEVSAVMNSHDDIKRIAVCFCGQLRQGVNAVKNLKNFFGDWYQQIDFFVHTWDQNSHRNVMGLQTLARPDEPVLAVDLDNFISAYKPKYFLVENQKKYYQEILENYGSTGTLINAYYSFYKSIELKKTYEQENNFTYDVVVKLRPDIIFPKDRTFDQDLLEYSANPEAIYSLRHDDIYQIGNSANMNIAADFYNTKSLHGNLDWPMNKFLSWLEKNKINFTGLNDYRSTIIRPESSYFCSLNNYDEICLINSQLYNRITFSCHEMGVYYKNYNNPNDTNDMFDILNRLLGQEETAKLKNTLKN